MYMGNDIIFEMKKIKLTAQKIVLYGIIIIQFIIIANLFGKNFEMEENLKNREFVFYSLLSKHRNLNKCTLHEYSKIPQYDKNKYEEIAKSYAFLIFVGMSYDYSEIYDTGIGAEIFYIKRLYKDKIITDKDLNDPFCLRNSFSDNKDFMTFHFSINPLVIKDLESYNEFTIWLRKTIMGNGDIDFNIKVEDNIFEKNYNIFSDFCESIYDMISGFYEKLTLI